MPMRISLIGMSGCGKTHWSREFAKHGFKHFCCDELIAEKLTSVLTKPDGMSLELGQWMGFPYETHYKDREKKYLTLEMEVLEEILSAICSGGCGPAENIIVDTTGSVIYAGNELLEQLRSTTMVVYIETAPHVRKRMLEKYIKNKRPVLWRGLYNRKKGESGDAALSRCYPNLLASRERIYARYAHKTLDYDDLTKDGFGIEDLIRIIESG